MASGGLSTVLTVGVKCQMPDFERIFAVLAMLIRDRGGIFNGELVMVVLATGTEGGGEAGCRGTLLMFCLELWE